MDAGIYFRDAHSDLDIGRREYPSLINTRERYNKRIFFKVERVEIN